MISDSYHDVGAAACDAAGLAYRPLSPEGKNYRDVVAAAASGDFDLLARNLAAEPVFLKANAGHPDYAGHRSRR